MHSYQFQAIQEIFIHCRVIYISKSSLIFNEIIGSLKVPVPGGEHGVFWFFCLFSLSSSALDHSATPPPYKIISYYFLNGPTLALNYLFFICLFIVQQRKLVASKIQTRIIGVKGESTDHYTSTMALFTIIIRVENLYSSK